LISDSTWARKVHHQKEKVREKIRNRMREKKGEEEGEKISIPLMTR